MPTPSDAKTWVRIALLLLLLLSVAGSAPTWTRDAPSAAPIHPAPTVPIVFIPGYAASAPRPDHVLAFTFQRGFPPEGIEISGSYHAFIRSLERAGDQKGTTLFRRRTTGACRRPRTTGCATASSAW